MYLYKLTYIFIPQIIHNITIKYLFIIIYNKIFILNVQFAEIGRGFM